MTHVINLPNSLINYYHKLNCVNIVSVIMMHLAKLTFLFCWNIRSQPKFEKWRNARSNFPFRQMARFLPFFPPQ